MFFITKGKEPEELTIFRRNILKSKKFYSWEDCPIQVKEEIKYSLAVEQDCLCAYCTREIDENCDIEHFHSRCKFPTEMFDYNNMLGVDNKKALSWQFKNVCEDGRGSKDLEINPLDKQMMDEIYYLSDGTIKHDKYQNDLDKVLHLNEPIFKNKRRDILKGFKELIGQGLDNEYLYNICKNKPYAGIVLYYLKNIRKNPNYKM